MPNMKALSLKVISYKQTKKCDRQVFQLKVKGHGQGYVFKIYGTNGKVLS